MKNIPIWQDIKTKDYPHLKKNIQSDILIVGGGITGINLLYSLKSCKEKITLVEKNKIGFGVTSRSTAKITFLQQDIYSKLMTNFDEKIAHKYYLATKDAIKNIKKIVDKEHISCDLQEADSYLYAFKKSEIAKVEQEKKILTSFNENCYDASTLPNGMQVQKAFYVKGTYTFHPLKYVDGLAKKSINENHKIYENTNIYKIVQENDYYLAYTENNIIKAKKIVLACHYPYFLIPYFFPLKSYLEKSYLTAKKTNIPKNFSAINIKKPIYSIRFYKDMQILLTDSHELGKQNNRLKCFNDLKDLSLNDSKYLWSNTDVMTLDNLPYIGLIKDNMYLATGYNTWGMTSSMIASMVLKDLLLNKSNQYASVFSPKRSLSKDKIMGFGISVWASTYSYINSKINLYKSWYHQNPYFTKIDGIKVAIYTDENNKKHIVKIRCPHLGCNLLWNEVEKLWECPCHGSVFDMDGSVIIGPSNYDIKYEK